MKINHTEITMSRYLYLFLMGGILLCYPVIQAFDSSSIRYPVVLIVVQIVAVIAGIRMGKFWRDPGFMLMATLIIYQMIRVVIKDKDSFFSNSVCESVFNGLWCIAGCYGIGKALTIKQLQSFLSKLIMVWTICILIHCIISLYAAWTNQEIYNLSKGAFWGITWYDRLLVGYRFPTIAGSVLSISGLIALCATITKKKPGVKVFYCIALLIISITLSLTDTRASIISLSAGAGIAVFIVVYKQCLEKANNPYRWITAIICMIVVSVVFLVVIMKFSTVFNAVKTNKISIISIAKAESITDAIEARGFSGTDPLSGRTGIWREVIHYLFNHPVSLFFGESIYQPMNGPNMQLQAKVSHCHNMPLQILLESGLIGLLLVICFGIYISIRAFRIIKSNNAPLWLKLIPSVAICILIGDLAECYCWFKQWNLPVLAFLFVTVGIINAYGDPKANDAENLQI